MKFGSLTIWVWLPKMSVIIKLSINGHRRIAKSQRRWWTNWRRTNKVSTLFLWCWTRVRVVLSNRLSSCVVCVVWWRSLKNQVIRVKRLLKIRFCLTLLMGFRYSNTSFRRTVRVKVWRIRLWKQQMRVIWRVVSWTLPKTWLFVRKIATHWGVSKRRLWKKAIKLLSRFGIGFVDVILCTICITPKPMPWF